MSYFLSKAPPPPAAITELSLPVTGHRFFLLFLFLLADLAFYPFVSDTLGARYYVFRALGIAITVVTIYAVSFRKGLIFIALLLGIPAMMEHTVFFRTGIGALSAFNVFVGFAFDVFVIVVMFRRIYAPDKPTGETLFGALCIYLLMNRSPLEEHAGWSPDRDKKALDPRAAIRA